MRQHQGRARRSLRWLVFVLAMGGYLVYVLGHTPSFARLFSVSWEVVLALGALFVGGTLCNAVALRVLTGACGLRLFPVENYAVSVFATYANYLPAGGGVVAKGVYLKHRHRFPYSHLVALSAGTYVLGTTVSGATGLTLLACAGDGAPAMRHLLAACFAVLLAVGLSAAVGLGRLPLGRAWVPDFVRRVQEGWRMLFADRRRVGALAALSMLNLGLMAMRYHLAARALDGGLSLPGAFFMAVVTGVATHLSMVPGGLGVNEGAAGLVAGALGQSVEAGVTLATLDRMVSLALTVVLGNLGLLYLAREGRREVAG